MAFKNAGNHKMQCWDKYGSKPNKKRIDKYSPSKSYLEQPITFNINKSNGQDTFIIIVVTPILKGILDNEKPFFDFLQFYSCHYLFLLLFFLLVLPSLRQTICFFYLIPDY